MCDVDFSVGASGTTDVDYDDDAPDVDEFADDYAESDDPFAGQRGHSQLSSSTLVSSPKRVRTPNDKTFARNHGS